MISIVICHRNPDYLSALRTNIAATVGVPHEILAIDNTSNKYNIFQAYNEGVRLSQYPLLVFVHEDLLFHTPDWGKNLVAHFSDPQVGLVGVIGGTAFPRTPAAWWNDSPLNIHHVNIIQHWGNGYIPHWPRVQTHPGNNVIQHYSNPHSEVRSSVVAVDGLFFAIPRMLFDSIRFDDTTFHGFHCYDTDTCLQVLAQGKTVNVVYDILIEHFSTGNANNTWIGAMETLADKWHDFLPVFVTQPSEVEKAQYAYKALMRYCLNLRSLNYDPRYIKLAIKKHWPADAIKVESPDRAFLRLWRRFGYRMANYITKVLKRLEP